MKNQILFIILCLGSCFLYLDSYSQITRGAQYGELYLSTDWYQDNNGDIHYAIFRSDDNGATITLQYESSTASPPSEMGVGRVLGDATPGALYNYGGGELWVSFNYGESWEYGENYTSTGFYTSGSVDGEIYKNGTDVEGTLFYSNNYGSSFYTNNLDIKFYLEVGTEPGELYGKSGFAGIGFNLKYSFDYGQNFITIPIDSTVAFWSISGHHPRISRGTEPGEMYLVSWWLDSNYKIFHSIDTGYTWTEKYESEYIDLYFWRVSYTAGRDPGSFYVMRSRINDAGDHIWLYIDYSSDYGETFTTYFHDLDSTLTAIRTPELKKIELSNAPNPFNGKTNIYFSLDKDATVKVFIFEYSGRQIQTIIKQGTKGLNKVQFDSSGLPAGVYFYNLEINGSLSDSKKMTILK